MLTKKKNEKKTYDTLYKIVFVSLIIYLTYTLGGQIMQLTKLEQDFSTEENRYKMANTIKDTLEKERQSLNDPAYVEKIAREELGMTRKGELPYIPGNNQ